MEKTLVLLKPDAVRRGLCGAILSRFEQKGLQVSALRMLNFDEALVREHYQEHVEKAFFSELAAYILSGPVVAIVLAGPRAVEQVRRLVGATDPLQAGAGTIRGDYSHMSFEYADNQLRGIPNLIHASGDAKEAEKEIDHWFSDSELYDYHVITEKFTR